jgi:hypothetical protein
VGGPELALTDNRRGEGGSGVGGLLAGGGEGDVPTSNVDGGARGGSDSGDARGGGGCGCGSGGSHPLLFSYERRPSYMKIMLQSRVLSSSLVDDWKRIGCPTT